MIEGLRPKEPVGAVLTIGTKGSNGAPTDRDRFYIKVPDSADGERIQHPAFGAFNTAAPEHRTNVRGVLVHATEPECFEWHRKAQKLQCAESGQPFRNHSKLPACTGDGRKASRLVLLEGGGIQHAEIPCPNDLCKFAQQPNPRTPPACKPWARLLFQPIWRDGSKLPTPLMKFTTQSWHTISALVGFFEHIREQAGHLGIANPSLFGLTFEMTLTTKTSPEAKTKFPVVRFSPTMQVQAFLMAQAASVQELAGRKQYMALTDGAEQDPAVVLADKMTIEPAPMVQPHG
jgi:hypothetical protein